MNNQPDRLALEAIYNSTDGDNWLANDNWLTDAPLAEWHGVTVDANGRVFELDLEENLLSGRLSPGLGGLTKLVVLSLAVNSLSGRIPRELGSLTNLARLGLSYNKLSGGIPPQLGNLANLTSLDLSSGRSAGPDRRHQIHHHVRG